MSRSKIEACVQPPNKRCYETRSLVLFQGRYILASQGSEGVVTCDFGYNDVPTLGISAFEDRHPATATAC